MKMNTRSGQEVFVTTNNTNITNEAKDIADNSTSWPR